MRALWSPETSGESCLICGQVPATLIELRQVRVRGFGDFEWGKLTASFCRRHGMDWTNAWLRRTLFKGWWNFSAFFPNFLAVAFDAVALIRSWRLHAAVDIPAPDSLLQLARSRGREHLVEVTRDGMGERVWTSRRTPYAEDTDPALQRAMDALLDAEHWSLHEDDLG